MKKQNTIFKLIGLIFLLNSCVATEEEYVKMLAEKPDSIETREKYAHLLKRNKKYDEALKEYNILIKKTSDVKYKYDIGIIYLLQDKEDEGLEIIEEVFDENPDFDYYTDWKYATPNTKIKVDRPKHWLRDDDINLPGDYSDNVKYYSIYGMEFIFNAYPVYDTYTSYYRNINSYVYNHHNSLKRASGDYELSPLYVFQKSDLGKYDPKLFLKEHKDKKLTRPVLAYYIYTSFRKGIKKRCLRLYCVGNFNGAPVDWSSLYRIEFECDKEYFDINAVILYKAYYRFFLFSKHKKSYK